jgi:uncharacterized protein YutE (UPF0331/DUF86 family)
MVDEAVVRDRLSTLRLNARRLASIAAAGRERFLADEDLHLKAERCLQLCLQAILDIGTHIIAAETLERPAGYEDVVPALGHASILPPELVARLAGIAGLRNILVHDYLAVDHGLLFDNLIAGLPDFEAFASAVDVFLGSHER